MRKPPISPVLRTWQPPQSSRLNPGTSTERTRSPYFSPNSAMAPCAIASAYGRSSILVATARETQFAHHVLDRVAIVLGERAVEGEVEAQAIGMHQRSRLAHAGSQPLAQRGVEQMGGGVVALGAPAQRLVHREREGGARLDAPRLDHHVVVDHPGAVLLRVDDRELDAGRGHASRDRRPGRPTRRRTRCVSSTTTPFSPAASERAEVNAPPSSRATRTTRAPSSSSRS